MTDTGSFERLFEHTTDPAFILDPAADRFVSANAAGCTLLGYTRAQLLETPVSTIHPGELPQLQAQVIRVLTEGRSSTITLTCKTLRGSFVPVEMSFHAFTSDEGVRVLALVRDRSEHR